MDQGEAHLAVGAAVAEQVSICICLLVPRNCLQIANRRESAKRGGREQSSKEDYFSFTKKAVYDAICIERWTSTHVFFPY